MMETIEHFSDFLRKIGAHNFLAIGIVIIVIWLLISGFRKGLKKKGREKEPEENTKNENDLSD
jgi:hypothetical protein